MNTNKDVANKGRERSLCLEAKKSSKSSSSMGENDQSETVRSQKGKKFEEIYERYWKLLLSISWDILKSDEANDAFQGCLLRIYNNMDKIDAVADLKTRAFVCKIMRNEALRIYKTTADRRKREISFESDMDNHLNAAYSMEYEQTLTDEVKACFDMLSSEDRKILVLRHVSGYSNVELEKILKIPGQTVRKRISRARRKLEDIMLKRGVMRYRIE